MTLFPAHVSKLDFHMAMLTYVFHLYLLTVGLLRLPSRLQACIFIPSYPSLTKGQM